MMLKAEARLSNVVTDWINATQERVAVLGVHNVPASRWYAQTALAIHNAVAKGGASPQALAGAGLRLLLQPGCRATATAH
jgi:hypothetical protein